MWWCRGKGGKNGREESTYSVVVVTQATKDWHRTVQRKNVWEDSTVREAVVVKWEGEESRQSRAKMAGGQLSSLLPFSALRRRINYQALGKAT